MHFLLETKKQIKCGADFGNWTLDLQEHLVIMIMIPYNVEGKSSPFWLIRDKVICFGNSGQAVNFTVLYKSAFRKLWTWNIILRFLLVQIVQIAA